MNKIIPRKILSAACLYLLIIPLIPPAIIFAAEEFYSDDNTLKMVLDNGITVVIHEIRKAPITSIDIAVKAGSATEDRFSGGGISHLLEHMIFKGGADEKSKRHNKEMKLLGGDINAFTAHDFTAYTATVPSENTVRALKIMKELIASPYFDALELKKEKEVILDEIRRNKDNPARLVSDLSWQLAFREHPYKYPVIGYNDLFERLDKEDLDKYYSAKYSTEAMILVISGDVTRKSLYREVENIFGPLKRNFSQPLPNITEPEQLKRRDRVEYRSISLAHVALSYRSASINDAWLYPLDIIALSLGAGEDFILTKELRNRRKLVHHITCRNVTLRDAGLFYIYFTADPEKVDEAIDAVLEELEKIKSDGLGESDLKKSKIIAEADFINGLETAQARSRDIYTSEVIANDYNFSKTYLEEIFKVGCDEIKSAAKRYFKRERLNTVRILPAKKEKVAEGSDSKQTFSRKLTKEDMTNGIRILVSEDHSTPNCSLSAVFLGGVRAEDDTNNGISNLVSQLLLDGTKTKSEEEIKSGIESVGGSIRGFSGNNSFGINIDVLSKDWRKAVEAISDVIINPVFDGEKIEKEKNLALAAIKARNDDIVQSGLLLLKRNFYKEHPYRFHPLGTAETINNLSRDDILNFYKSLCAPRNMVFAISGDIDKEEVMEEVKKQFALFERESALPSPPPPERPEGKKELSRTMKREQSLVILGFPSVKLSDSDRYTFEVIDSIMSGYNGRIYHNVRDSLGMGYAVGSSFQPGLEQGSFIFYALSSRENSEAIKNAILKEIKELKTNVVAQEELLSAQRYLITRTISDLQRNETFAFKISLDELYGLGYKDYETYKAKIESVTPAQIKRAANQYFDTNNFLIVIIYGEGGGV